MGSIKKIELMKFLAAFLAAMLLVTFIPFDVINVFAVYGNGTYEINVYDDLTNNPIEGAKVVLKSTRNDFDDTEAKTTNSQGSVSYDLKKYFDIIDG